MPTRRPLANAFAFALFLVVLSLAGVARAAPGDVLRKVLTPLPGAESVANAVVQQPDGKILLVGYATFGNRELAVTRLNADGTIDPSYGADRNGTAIFAVAPGPNEALAAALQPDGKLVVAGYVGSLFNVAHMVVARLNADGSVDTSFANRVLDVRGGPSSAGAVAIQPDGKILLGGTSEAANSSSAAFTVVRLGSDGSLDSAFGTNGVFVDPNANPGLIIEGIHGMVLQPDGKIVVVGDDAGVFKILRLDASGNLDPSWSTGGSTQTVGVRAHALALQPDGSVVVGGQAFRNSANHFAVLRFTPNGALDASFGSGGIALAPTIVGQGFAVVVQPDGKPVLTGLADDNTLQRSAWIVRFNADGTPDPTFGTNGEATATRAGNLQIWNHGLLLRADGTLVAAGSLVMPDSRHNMSAIVFTSTGALDTTFDGGGIATFDPGSTAAFASASAVQADGKLVAAGTLAVSGNNGFTSFVMRYLPDGALDTSFGSNGVTTFIFGNAEAVAIQADGRIVVGGQTQFEGGCCAHAPAAAFARFNADGTLDPGFGSGGVAVFVPASGQDGIKAIAIQPDGMIVGAGSITSGATTNGLVMRVTPGGTLDATFGTGGFTTLNIGSGSEELHAIALQADGRIVAAGRADFSATQSSMAVARLRPDGTTDSPFGGAILNFFGADSEARAVALQPDGKIVLAGFANSGADDDYALVRLFTEGGIDASFGSQGFVRTDLGGGDNALFAVKVLPSGKVVGAGRDGGAFGVVQYLANGSLDAAFGNGGRVAIAMNSNAGADVAHALSIASDGRLYVSGDASRVVGLAIVAGDAATATAAASISLASSANPAAAGQSVTFTATVSGSAGTPTGTVTFDDGGNPIAGCVSVALSSGSAQCSTSSLAAGAHAITVAYSGDATYAAATSSAFNQSITTAATGNPLLGLSTRGAVGSGDNVLIGGFIVGGTTPKTVIVRARGPSTGVAGALADPTLTLVPANGDPAIFNDDWGSASNAAQVQASGFAPGDAKESAILVTLNPGAYTAIVNGAGGTTGVAIVEIFEVDHPEVPLTAISTRGNVQTGDNVMIGGFIIPGSTPRTVVVRARGPSLTAAGVADALADPTLTLVPGNGDPSITNDDWGSAANAAQLQASGFAPSNAKESALLITLNPGAYTAIVSGVGGTTGVAIVEVFAQ